MTHCMIPSDRPLRPFPYKGEELKCFKAFLKSINFPIETALYGSYGTEWVLGEHFKESPQRRALMARRLKTKERRASTRLRKEQAEQARLDAIDEERNRAPRPTSCFSWSACV